MTPRRISRAGPAHRARRAAALALGAAFLAACGDEPTAPTGEATRARANAVEQAALTELTHAVARALGDQGVRSYIKAQLRAAPFREHKLEFRTFIRGEQGGPLLAKMSEATGRSREELLAVVDAIRPLELYMPGAAARSAWKGDAGLYVAGQIDDGGAIAAYDVSGREVALDPAQPAALPTLALVPVEAIFSDPIDMATARNVADQNGEAIGTLLGTTRGGSGISAELQCVEMVAAGPTNAELQLIEDCGGGGGGGTYYPPPPPPPPGIFFTKMVIRNDGEAWLRGDPELEVHVSGTQYGTWHVIQTFTGAYQAVYAPNHNRRVFNDCAGARAAGYKNFNRESEGTYTPTYPGILFAEAENFAVDEQAKGPWGIVYHRRLAQLAAPFYINTIERDDGKECPAPPRKVEFAMGFEISVNPFKFRLTDFGWEDVSALFGGGNEFLTWATINSMDELEQLSNRFLPGGDVDLTVTNRGFSRYNIPWPQDPYNP